MPIAVIGSSCTLDDRERELPYYPQPLLCISVKQLLWKSELAPSIRPSALPVGLSPVPPYPISLPTCPYIAYKFIQFSIKVIFGDAIYVPQFCSLLSNDIHAGICIPRIS